MKYKSCYSPYTACARPCYKCCPTKECGPSIPKNALKICGSVNKTNVYNSDRKIRTVLNTFYLTIKNCTGKTLHDVWLDIDIRVLECACDTPVMGDGSCSCCFDPDQIQVLFNAGGNSSSCCGPTLCSAPEHYIDECGVHVKLDKVHPGTSIATVIVPLQNPELLCPPPCSLLPSLFTLKIVKCYCDRPKVVFQTSTVIGCNPTQICCT